MFINDIFGDNKKKLDEVSNELIKKIKPKKANEDAIDDRFAAQYNTPQALAKSRALDQLAASGTQADYDRLGVMSPQQIERDYQAMRAKEPEQDAAVYRNPALTPSARSMSTFKTNPKGVPIKEIADTGDLQETEPTTNQPRTGLSAEQRAQLRKDIDTVDYNKQQQSPAAPSREQKADIRKAVKAQEVKEQGVAEGSVYKKDQDLSSISTQELEAFVNKHWAGGIPTWGQGESVKRAMRELRRRQKPGVAEAEKKPHPKTWHDVDPKLGKAVDKMSQAEKVKKGLAHPDTLKKKGVAEGLGLYGPFTVTINTGERPQSRTKTKKFRREDDAILYAEDWLEDFPQYSFATAEVTDPAGNVVWTTNEQGVAEGISVVDQDYDLDQLILTLDIEGKRVSFTYTDYEEDFENAERRDVFDQLQEQPWYKGLDHPTKMEILDAAYRAIRGLEPQEYRPTVGDEPLDEDWKKVNRKDKTPGMSRKAVKAYRRENPGSKLQTAVTTKPSKLKKGSKSAKRRKSFCARMKGMKRAHAGAKTKRNPDSPINKALRRWNCESIEEMRDLVMIAEQRISAMREGGFDIPEIPRAPQPRPEPKNKAVGEGSVQDKLHRRHQELRKKSGLPDPNYYQELKATYDLPDEERYAKAAELKKKYQVKEARKAEANFDVEDLKRLEQIRDLPTLKAQAMALISKPSERPMKPEKVAWFDAALDRMDNRMGIIKLMYDLLLSGEGHQVIGSKRSMNPNSYRSRFGEQGVAETTGDPKFDKMLKGITGKRQVAKQQKADTKQQARDAFGGMFGGGNPADQLSIRKKGVAEGTPNFLDDDFYAYDPETMEIKGTWSHKSVGRRHSEYRAQQEGWKVVSGMRAKSLGLQYPDRTVDENFALADVDAAMQNFLARGGEVKKGKTHKPRSSEKTDFGSRHIGGRGEVGRGKGTRIGKAAKTDPGGKPVVTVEELSEDVEKYVEELERAGYEIVNERRMTCPECGGAAYADEMLAEKQDACYHKVKSRYKVWPSAYASGALVRCRKKGAKNWGNKSK